MTDDRTTKTADIILSDIKELLNSCECYFRRVDTCITLMPIVSTLADCIKRLNKAYALLSNSGYSEYAIDSVKYTESITGIQKLINRWLDDTALLYEYSGDIAYLLRDYFGSIVFDLQDYTYTDYKVAIVDRPLIPYSGFVVKAFEATDTFMYTLEDAVNSIESSGFFNKKIMELIDRVQDNKNAVYAKVKRYKGVRCVTCGTLFCYTMDDVGFKHDSEVVLPTKCVYCRNI